ncbi:PqiC family protein [Uliginosibacterium sediminicola]|uniref:PqiC family protein n=1 Tax=Uliginosibacterium sediminicola TaxID=2024550 RepID=A0ABU9Z2T9_9RHOO
MSLKPWMLVASLLLGACSSQPTRYYALSGGHDLLNQPVGRVLLAVGPASVPDALDRSAMLVRRGPNSVEVLDEQRWIDTPKNEIPRVLATRLSELLPATPLAVWSQHAASSAPWRVLIDVQRFDVAPGEAASVELSWTLLRDADGARSMWRSSASEPLASNSTPAQMAAALSRALDQIAQQMATQLKQQDLK